jgi:hypothetical protein
MGDETDRSAGLNIEDKPQGRFPLRFFLLVEYKACLELKIACLNLANGLYFSI